jgi:radical SAM superfamily enzyme YgiQ (UPF0313 family)
VPTPCKNLEADHSEYIELLSEVEKIPGIKKVFIRSGIRFDYMLADRSDAFFRKLVRDHVSGQLKVAPEHCAPRVLDAMGKPHFEVYEKFRRRYFELTKSMGKEQYLVPYLMSSHPGCELSDAVALAECLKRDHYAPEQVQDFYPTPGTASTVMYYTGIDPLTMKRVFVPNDPAEKRLQRALLQCNKPENAALVREALRRAGREELIGFGPECLVRPENGTRREPPAGERKKGTGKPQSERKREPVKGRTAASKSAKGVQQAPKGKGTPHGKHTAPTRSAKAPQRPASKHKK